ncbi:hypothetical protein CASFOL_037610 [Castilleja foliolosa]|uniref:KIB1-4 beta-propeller domain-containing protein n=1 Tax=Castilleja foliolosa TaxID=1961234 RepID=A0ABD3BMV4_9LAMI
MASLVKRTGFSLLRRISTGSRNLMMMMSRGVNSSPSPWLMLPPVFEEGGDMVYKFYNLSEDKEESFRTKRSISAYEMGDDAAKFVGSSHGWLALFNQRNNHLFLYNPITCRHIKLPPIETLPHPMINLTRDGRGSVSKLILSSSPDDDDECIAMMTFGPGDRLAFCHPCRSSTEWTPIGQLFFRDKETGKDYENPLINFSIFHGRAYEDFVYCSGLRCFTCITQIEIDLFGRRFCHPTCELEDWDLSDDPISTTCSAGGLADLPICEEEWMNQNFSLLKMCKQIPYIVFTELHNQHFIVIRFVMDRVAPDGSCADIEEILYNPISQRLLVDKYPYKTIGFCVLKVDYRQEDERRVVDEVRLIKGSGTLDGLTMFIGMNHSFAVSSADFPNLKPNSIYFTDANKNDNSIYGGHDIGIFDFANKTLSDYNCYPFVDVPSFKRIAPPPMWFTPSLGI